MARHGASIAISSSTMPASRVRSPPPTQGSSEPMSLYDNVRDLPLVVEGYALDALEQQVSSGFLRKSTVIRLLGGGEEGLGEDVTSDAKEHDRAQVLGPVHDL